MTQAVLELQQLSVDIQTPRGTARILRGLDLELSPGERLGIVGESGSGKSMMALAIMGLLPDAARARGLLTLSGEDLLTLEEDRLCAIRGRKIAMIFQEPMTALNPVQPIGDQVAEGPRLHLGFSRSQAMNRARSLLAQVGLSAERFSPRLYPHQLSGGQRQRVMIAIALACDPDILIADEPTTALDVSIQADILDLIVNLTEERQMGLVMISHDLGVIARTCRRMAVMYAGRFVEIGETGHILSSMAHPYSLGLHGAMPRRSLRSDLRARDRPRLATIPGTIPDPHAEVEGCAFASRCIYAEADCRRHPPRLTLIAPNHHVACHHPQSRKRLSETVH